MRTRSDPAPFHRPDHVPPSRRFAKMRRPRAVRNAWFTFRYLVGSYRLTYPLMHVLPKPYARVMVQPDMDACIEGLPRSANTFAGWAFMYRNPQVRLAHHMHVPAQADRAVRLGVPCVALVREPLGNLTSLVIAGEGDLSCEVAFRIYIHYFRRLASIRNRLAICTFDEVLDDPSIVAGRLNESFGTTFDATPMSAEDKARIVQGLERNEAAMHARPGHGTVPNLHKEGAKPRIKEDLSRHRLLPVAQAAYAEVVNGIQVPVPKAVIPPARYDGRP